ncbi:MAG: hypothetical protein LBT01_00255 [Spirochaetaceae bacterium]|jgi:hypothetical protein|nr:hypothetical protein [Spirochaetaceae bacterium]
MKFYDYSCAFFASNLKKRKKNVQRYTQMKRMSPSEGTDGKVRGNEDGRSACA